MSWHMRCRPVGRRRAMKKFMALFEMMPLHIGGSDMVSPIVAESRRPPTRPRSSTFTGDFSCDGPQRRDCARHRYLRSQAALPVQAMVAAGKYHKTEGFSEPTASCLILVQWLNRASTGRLSKRIIQKCDILCQLDTDRHIWHYSQCSRGEPARPIKRRVRNDALARAGR